METRKLNGIDFISIIKSQSIDQAISLAGDFGKYQYKLMFYLGIQWLITSFVLMIQPFLMQTPTFLCPDPNDPSSSYVCDEREACMQKSFELGANSPENIVTEFHLYCERSSLRELCGTVFFLGGGIGTLLFSHAADKYGRKKALLMAFTLGVVSLLLMSFFSYEIYPFYAFLATSWAGFDAYFAFSFIMLSEAGGTKLRGISNGFLLTIWGIGLCLFVVIAYFVQNWRVQILWVIAVPACVSILGFTQMYESPRFLYAKGQYEECQQVLTKIARQNKNITSPDSRQISSGASNTDNDNTFELHQEAPIQETTYATIITNKWLRKRFVIFTILILYLYLSYNGILFALADIGGNIYENSLVVSAAELTGYIASIFMLNKIKRKASFIMIMLSASISGIIFACIPYFSCQDNTLCSQGFLEQVFSLIIKFCISLSFGLIFVYGSELFPTVARSKCIGLASCIGRGASMATTWINHGLILYQIKPMFFYGSLGLIMLFLVNELPETFGKNLADYLPADESAKKGSENEFCVENNNDDED